MIRYIVLLSLGSYMVACTTGAEQEQQAKASLQVYEHDTPAEEKHYNIDVHELGAGNVTAEAVADAHEKDLVVQGTYGVNFINYWINEDRGTVMCLSEAYDSDAVIKTHREAHGLISASIAEVIQGE